jgi:hypothetical protein
MGVTKLRLSYLHTRSFSQNCLFGLVRPSAQFLSVPKLTPSFAAKFSWASLIFTRYLVSNSASDWVLFWQGANPPLQP